jgi:autotransporter-associated beta strand protein
MLSFLSGFRPRSGKQPAARPTQGRTSPAPRLGFRPSVMVLEDRVTPTTLHWIGASGNQWGTAANWLENAIPNTGDALVFDTTTAGFSATANGFGPVNNVSGLTGLTLTINDGSAANDFNVTGTAVGLAAGGITATVTSGTGATVGTPLTLSAATAVTVSSASPLILTGVLSGAGGIDFGGGGTLSLSNGNTYTGNTNLNSGTLVLTGSHNPNISGPLGSGSGTLFLNGTTATPAFLQAGSGGTSFMNPITLPASGTSNTFNGSQNIDLFSSITLNNTLFITDTGSVILTNGATNITGSATTALSINAPGGFVTLASSGSSYTGATVLTAGSLQLVVSSGATTGPIGNPTSAVLQLNGGTLFGNGVTISNAFVVGGPTTIGNSSTVTLTGPGTLNSTLTVGNNAATAFAGPLSGPGGITVDAPVVTATIQGTTANTYSGTTAVTLGNLNLNKTAGVDAVAGPLTVAVGNTVTWLQANQVNDAVAVTDQGTLNLNGFTDTIGPLSGTVQGSVNLSTTGSALTVGGGNGTGSFAGTITGSGGLTKVGTGTQTLTGNNPSYTGTMAASAGTLAVNANFGGSPVTISGGTLAGIGTVKSITTTGGTVSPGGAGTVGTLTTAAAASALNGANLLVDVNNPAASDALVIGSGGTVNLTGATLSVNVLGSAPGNVYVIVSSASGGISGTFTGLVNGVSFVAGGHTFQIHYTTTSVTLTDVGTIPTTLHWTGAISNLWNAAGNWVENTGPVSGDTLIFDTTMPGFSATANGFAPVNNLSGLTGLTLTVNDASAAGDFNLTGNAVSLAGAGTNFAVTVGSGAGDTVAMPLSIASGMGVTVNPGSTLSLSGVVSGSGNVTFGGGGTLSLTAANTYTGSTTVNSGTLVLTGLRNANVSGPLGDGTGTLFLNGTTATPVVLQAGSGGTSFQNPITVSASATSNTIGGSQSFNLFSPITLNNTLFITDTAPVTLTNGAMTITGSAATALSINAPGGTVQLASSGSSYTGSTVLTAGTLLVPASSGTSTGPIGDPTSAVLQLNGGTFLGNNTFLGNPFVVGGAATISSAGAVTLNGSGTLNSTLTVANNAATTFGGVLSGTGGITIDSPLGTVTIQGTSPNTFTGTTTLTSGTLVVNANDGSSPVSMAGGTLSGSGTVRSIAATGGIIDAGSTGTVGTLTTAAGAFASTLNGTTLRVDVSNPVTADDLDIGNGATVNLTGATLSVNVLSSAPGNAYVIVSSTSGGISGTFNGLANNATFTSGGRTLQVNYSATVVTLTDVTPQTLHWIGGTGASGNQWGVAANWAENQVPVSGDTLVFDTTTAGFSATANGFAPVNTVSGLTGLILTVNDASAAGDFNVTGNAVGLDPAGITAAVVTGTSATVAVPLTLSGATAVTVSTGSLVMSQAISGTGGITLGGVGSLKLTTTNSYSGNTTLNSGTLVVGADGALGNTAGTATVNGGATLDLAGTAYATAQPVVLAGGTLASSTGAASFAGPVTLTAASMLSDAGSSLALSGSTITLGATLTVTGAGSTTIGDVLSGSGQLSKAGTGSLALTGASGAGFTGSMAVSAGTLVVNANDPASPVSVFGGTLAGTGTVKSIATTGGALSPGGAGVVGSLTTAAGAFASALNGTTFSVDVNNPAASDTLAVGSGATVNLTGATLSLNVLGAAPGNTYTVISSASGGISGTFNGLANNVTFVSAGHTFQVAYTANAVTLTVVPSATVTAAAAASATFSTSGQSVNLSATVTSAAGTVSEGTETFTILNGATPVGTPVTVNVTSGAANATYTLPAATAGGTYTIRGVYNGTANFGTSTDTSHTLTVNPAAATTTASAATTTFSTGAQSVNLSATVTSPGGTVSEGTETFTVLNGATPVGTPVTVNVAAGAASASYALPAGTAAGAYVIRAVYNGTADFTTSTDTSHQLTITAASTTTTASPASATFSSAGQPVSLSATVTSAAGTVNVGTVTFTVLNGATPVGSPVTANVVAGAASASYALPAGTAGGTYTIRAAYSGTANFTTSTDATHSLTVNPAATTTAASAATTTFSTGVQSVNLTATVTSAAGTVGAGTLTFTVLNGATPVGSPVSVGVTGGAASASYSLPASTAGGTYTIQAAYGGTASFGASADATHTLTVNPTGTTTAATAASATFSVGAQSVNLTATVTSAAGTVGAGTVTFTVLNGTTPVGTQVTANVAAGAAGGSYALPAGTPAGTYVIRAVYSGAADFGTSTDTGHTLTIGSAATTTSAAAASTAFSVGGQPVNLSATVTSGAGVVNEGTETFTILNGATVIGLPVTVNVAAGAASATYALPAGVPAGTYTIQATYDGTTNLDASTDATHQLTVNPAGTTTAASAAATTFSPSGQSVNLAATVSSAAGVVIAGTVTFTILNGATVVGTPVTVNVAAGAASASYALPAGTAGGTYAIRAAYSGTADLAASTDTSHSLTVNPAVTTTVAAPATASFSSSGQSVNLSATVTGAAGVMNAGTETFTILSGTTVIGTPVTVNVAAGAASANYALPAGTAGGTYTIRAAYSGTTDFTASTDATHTLTISPASVIGGATGTSATWSSAPQTVTLTTTLTSPAGTVTGGTVTFTALSGGTVVGTPVTVLVVNGAATAGYVLPGHTPAGSYVIQAVYSGTSDFAGLTDTTQFLTVAPNPVLVGAGPFAVGADSGGSAVVTEYNPDGSPAAPISAFPGSTGGVRTAVADFNGDGTPDVVVGTGPQTTAEVKILDGKTRTVLFDVQPFADFTGGVFVAAGDVTGDGKADLVVTPDLSGGPRIEIYRGGGFQLVENFFTFTDDPNFRGGARAALGDLNGDGFADLVVSAGFGGGPRIAVYDGKSLASGQQVRLMPDFFLFEPALRNGAYVAVGDVNGDGFADVIGGGGPGGGPRVLVVSGQALLSTGAVAAMNAPVANFFAGNVENRGGIRVAAKNLDGDDHADLVVGDGTGAGSRVTAYLGKDLAAGSTPVHLAFDAFPGFTGGVFVG